MCANKLLVSLESSIPALQNDGSLILAFGGVFALESFEVPGIMGQNFNVDIFS